MQPEPGCPLTHHIERASMKLFRRMATSFLVIFFVVSALYQPAQGHRSQPAELYHRAWELVKDNYFDANYNGHNWPELEHKYDNQMRNTTDAYKCIKLMLETLNDPYTRFLDPRAFQDENDAIDARIVGIGINLQQAKETNHLVVTRTIENGRPKQPGCAQATKSSLSMGKVRSA